MRVFKLLSIASLVALAMASTIAVAADEANEKVASEKPVTNQVKQNETETSATVADAKPVTNQTKQNETETSAKVATPVVNPVNLQKKYFGFGPDALIQINGFMSAGLAQTDAKNKDAVYVIPGHGTIANKLGYAANSLAGLQITGNLNQQLSAVLQITATGEDVNGVRQYQPVVDWAFLRYKPNTQLIMRIGRMRIPAFLYSQTEEVGLTYAPVFLPPEVYRLMPFYNFNGMDATYTLGLGNSDWAVKVNPFFGQNQSKYDLYTNTPVAIPDGTTATFHEDYLYGGSVEIGNQYVTAHGAYAHTNLSMDLPGYIIGPIAVAPHKNAIENKAASFYSGGLKLEYQQIVLAGEFAHRDTEAPIAALSGAYGMMGVHVGKLLPYVMYAQLWTTNTSELKKHLGSELPEAQDSYGAGIDYYFSKNLVGKMGASRITPKDGTNGLFTTDPGKKHVMLYTASLDFAF